MVGGLKQMKDHVRAIQNIHKTTSSMKAVAISKFVKAEKIARHSKAMGLAANRFYEVSNLRKEAVSPYITFLACTSDRGLCGSMHYRITKTVKENVKKLTLPYDIVCIGERGKGILAFELGKYISLVVNGVGHKSPTFFDAALIVHRTFKRSFFMQGNIIYAHFINMMSFDVAILEVYSLPILLSSKASLRYEIEEITSYLEFSQVALVYYALNQTYIVEISSRINAMTSASKNAAKLAQQLMIEINRKRQQVITNELIDIVSGAEVLRE